ncbi:hypothetical protein DLJ47_21775 [Micromonospora sp. S4605]|nr:hypothetical protein DLJ47_21775 [Micromonospora sp. S4605]
MHSGTTPAARSPGAVKILGRQVAGFDQAVGNSHRFELVVAGNMATFAQHDNLAAYLTGTRSRMLVEASPANRVWGIGLAATDPRVDDPNQWQGLNLLRRRPSVRWVNGSRSTEPARAAPPSCARPSPR